MEDGGYGQPGFLHRLGVGFLEAHEPHVLAIGQFPYAEVIGHILPLDYVCVEEWRGCHSGHTSVYRVNPVSEGRLLPIDRRIETYRAYLYLASASRHRPNGGAN